MWYLRFFHCHPPLHPKMSWRWTFQWFQCCFHCFHPPLHPNASQRWSFLAFQHVCHYHLPRIQMWARGGPFDGFNATATASTSLTSKHEPEVDFSVVSTLLPPLPPPWLPNASWSGSFWRHHLLWRVFFLRHQQWWGGVKPTHHCVWMFSLLFRAPWVATLLPCLPPPNNNEGWPPCSIDNRAACHSFPTLRGGPYLHVNYFIIAIGIVMNLHNIKVNEKRIGLVNAMQWLSS